MRRYQFLQLRQFSADFFHHDPTQEPKVIARETKNFLPKDRLHHDKKTVYVPDALRRAQFVFLRTDSHRRPLQRPYTGPFKVIQRKEKCFLIDTPAKQDWVSIDRLKPASIPAVADDAQLPPYLNTRSKGEALFVGGGVMWRSFGSHNERQ